MIEPGDKVGYVIPEWPGQTHLWIWREVCHLREFAVAVRQVLGDEAPLQWREYNISGKKDFAVRRNGSEAVDVDVKSTNQWTFEVLNSARDVRGHKSEWIRGWDRQLSLYMVLKGRWKYFMLLKNKTTGAWKVIVYKLGDEELEIANEMIRKAELVNQLVQIERISVESVPVELKLADADVCAKAGSIIGWSLHCVRPRGPSLGADSRRLVLDSAGGNGNAGAFRRAHAGRVAAGSLVGGTRRLSTGANCRSNRRLLFPRHGDALHLNHTIRFAHDCAVSDAGRSTSVTRDR